MSEDLLADFMGSLLIVVPAIIGIIFAYWLYKKAGPCSGPRPTQPRDRTAVKTRARREPLGFRRRWWGMWRGGGATRVR